MTIRWAARAIAGVAAVTFFLAGAVASESSSGDWTMRRSERQGAVQFSLHSAGAGHSFSTTSDWPKSEFSGLDFSRAGTQDVRIALTRDAGRFDLEGVLRDGVGAGSFRFFPDARYAQQMKALGFSVVTDDQMTFAVHDVSLAFARDMKSESLRGLDADKLLAFRIHGVTHAMVQRVKGAGYSPDADKLIAMRIHGVTPEWIGAFRQRGYEKVSLDKLIEFRIHDVSPEFVDELAKLGYQHPEADQLVAMRIHNVTPEYVGGLQARGIKDLTIEKMVALKIHGVD
jgi:hypothetical protein